MRPIILFGLAVAAVRFALDAAKLDAALWIGVYFFMPVALLVAGLLRTYDDLPWRRLALGMLVVALCCWCVPNAISYTTAHLLGWQHGRFRPDPRFPVPESTLGKVGMGVGTGVGTAISGTIWLLFWGTLAVWLPGRIRRKRAASAA
jgi:hypothetical protein